MTRIVTFLGRGRAGHVVAHAGKGDSQVLADVRRSHALPEVLESGASALGIHTRQTRDLRRQHIVVRQLLIDRHSMNGVVCGKDC
jgi:indole-3-glycerol phosphate synthase